MGNDGGSIPKRSELVKQKTKKEKIDPELYSLYIWFYCSLSKQPLAQPIVLDQLGKLYNREAILEHLLDRHSAYGDADEICSYIKSIKDVKALTLTVNPEHTKKGTNSNIGQIPQFICPILQKEMNGRNRFVALWTCGCVMSEEAVKSMGAEICLNCSKPYTNEDLVTINPAGTDLEKMKKNMEDRKEKTKNIRKLKNKLVFKPHNQAQVQTQAQIQEGSNPGFEKRSSSNLLTDIPENLKPGDTDVVSNADNDKIKLYMENRQKRLKQSQAKPKASASAINSNISASKIIEKYSSSIPTNTKILNSIFISESDKKRQDENRNTLFKGTFNRYVA